MSSEFSEQDVSDQAQKYAGKIKEDNVSDLVDKEDKIKGLFDKASALKKYWDDACEVFALIKDRIDGTYTDTPWPTIASLAGALLYVFSPIDCIPDFIPIAGFVDDASVFGFVIMSASADLMKYRSWKSKRENMPSPTAAIEAKVVEEQLSEISATNIVPMGIENATANVVEGKKTIVKAKRTRRQPKKPVTEKCTPCDEIARILLSAKSRFDCSDIFMRDSEKFARKFRNISQEIRGRLHKVANLNEALAIIDCTVFGSADNGVLLDKNGIYTINGWGDEEYNGFVSWSGFAGSDYHIRAVTTYVVQICDTPKVGFSTAGSNLKTNQAIDLFQELRQAMA